MTNYFFSKLLTLSRLFIYLPVLFGIVSALILFIVATIDVAGMVLHVVTAMIELSLPESLHLNIVGEIIGAVDLYLIAIVLLIFSFGLYELFISEESINDNTVKLPRILAIGSLDELKDKLAKVIVMVLVVFFFQKVLHVSYPGPLEMMYFALSIAALSIGVYLLHKDSKFKKVKKSIDDNPKK